MNKNILIFLCSIMFISAACSLKTMIPTTESPKSPVAEEPRAVGTPIGLSEIKDLDKDRIYSVAAYDFNKDGYDDIVTGVYNGYSNIFTNNKDRTFTKNPLIAQKYTTQVIAVIDFDNDGNKDLILGNNQQPIVLLKGNGDGSFTLYKELDKTVVNAIVVGDFDNDGRQDFAIATQFKENFIYFNDGNGEFSKVKYSENVPAKAIVAADFDNDGKLDFAVGMDDRQNEVYHNEGNRKFALSAQLEGTKHTYSLAAVDANNDGRIDIIAGNNKEQNILYLNKETGFEAQNIFGIGNTYVVYSADLNGDGINEIILGNYEQTIQIYGKSGDSYSLIKEISTPFRNYVRSIAFGDFDKNGKADLVVGRESEISQIYYS